MTEPLPEAVRMRLVALADDTLATLAPAEVPTGLRPFVRFAPGRRVRAAGPALAAALERDEDFRARVVDRLRASLPDLIEAVEEDRDPVAADPADLVAVAYLLDRPGWRDRAEALARAERDRAGRVQTAAAAEALERLQEQLTQVRAAGRADVDRVRRELAAAKAEVAELRRKLHAAREDVRAARAEADGARAELVTRGAQADAELRRMRDRLAEAEQEREATRRAARSGRAAEDVRVRLLVDVLGSAAAGLRRELALPAGDLQPADLRPEDGLPGDSVAADRPSDSTGDHQGRGPEDPSWLDTLLALPRTHLVIDGYNVTKLGYGGLSLREQRERLVSGLAGLAARTGAEVTCCFDGADVDGRVVQARPRGVRVLFSASGQTADDLVRDLVAAEPAGRPVVVVSNDREVADGVRRSGARVVASQALLRRLDRG